MIGALAVLAVGCGNGFTLVDDDYGAATEADALFSGGDDGISAWIGPTGGQVTSSRARLVIPEGAVTEPVVIRMACRDGAGGGALGVVCDLGPDGQTFDVPIEVRLAFDGVPSGSYARRLRVGTWTDGAWVPLPESRYDPATGDVAGATTHFSTYGILLAPCEPPDCDATDLAACEGPDCLPPELKNAWTARMKAMLLPVTGDQAAGEVPFDPHVAQRVNLAHLSGSACRDVSGDGVPDSRVGKNVDKLGALWGGDPSSELTAALFNGYWNLIFDFHVAADDPKKPTRLAFYLAERDSDVNAAGHPYHALGGVNNPLGDLSVETDGATFRVTGDVLRVTYVLETVPFAIAVTDPVLSGTFVETPTGREIHDGSLTGLLYRADVRAMVDLAEAVCHESTPTPFECPFIDQLSPLFVGSYFTYDLDVSGCDRVVDEQPDCAAMSVCAYFAAEAATIEVLVPGS